MFRKKPKKTSGTLIRDASLEHRCEPPGCFEFCGRWKIDDTKRYPEFSVWKCDCGKHWHSTMNNGPWRRRGLWLTWERMGYSDFEKLGIEYEE